MADQKKPRLLSLDGGGARGWTQLIILSQIVLQLINKLRKDDVGSSGADDLWDEEIYPCLFFELITGSGTGGINAIMIGRLGMSIKQCEKAWIDLRRALQVDRATNRKLLSSESLENWAKALVEEYTGRENTRMYEPAVKAGEIIGDPRANNPTRADADLPMNYNTNGSRGCKVSVTAMRAQNVGMSTLFRTYRVRANQEFNCQIWEAIRATTASPLLYEPIPIGKDWSKQQFINAELGANNPVGYMIEEKQKVWLRQGNWPPPDIGCIVSIGSGKEKLISMPAEQQAGGVIGAFTGMFGLTKSPAEEREEKLYQVMVRIAKDCEKKHQQIKESFGKDEDHVYFRFNIEHGMQDIEETDYKEITTRSMRAHARDHIEHEESSIRFEDVVDKLVELTEKPRRMTITATTPIDSTAPPAYEKASYSGSRV